MKRWMALIAVFCLSSGALAQEPAPATESTTAEHASAPEGAVHVNENSMPVLSSNPSWAGSMMIIIIAMFVAAAVVGVVVRLNLPEPPPQPDHDDHGHDDHGHGSHGHDDHSKPAHGH